MTGSELLARPPALERAPTGRPYARLGARALILVAASLTLAAGSPWTAAILHALARLAYVFFAGISLRRASRLPPLFGWERERRFRSFRRRASLVMEYDAASLVALILVTAGSFEPSIPVAWVRGLALGLGVLGAGCKMWAARTLGQKAYYWHDFFERPEAREHRNTGPYLLFRNPMYTVGYAHAYGLALFFLSWPGLLDALFDQAAILAFHAAVERPHVRAMYGR